MNLAHLKNLETKAKKPDILVENTDSNTQSNNHAVKKLAIALGKNI